MRSQWACPDESNCHVEASQAEMVGRLATAVDEAATLQEANKAQSPRVPLSLPARVEWSVHSNGLKKPGLGVTECIPNAGGEWANWMVDSRREPPNPVIASSHRLVLG